MAEVKVSALTALTGANVANGDELYIVDTGSPNVSKKITADELAQMPQLSSRYAPIAATNRIWVPGTAFVATLGSPTLSDYSQHVSPIWRFDQTSLEGVSTSVTLPNYWTTFTATLYWTNVSSTSGNVLWGLRYNFLADTDALSGNTDIYYPATAAPTTAGNVKTTLHTSPASLTEVADEVFTMAVIRWANDASDTLTNDAGLFGVLLTRVS